MRKIFLICIFIIILSIYLSINININKNIETNKEVLYIVNNIFKEQKIEIYNEFLYELPKLQINDIDYVGIINIPKNNLTLPIESKCNNSIIGIQSICTYSNAPLIILGTNIKDSLNSITLYNIEDEINFTNMLGQQFQYKIKKIKRINKLDELDKYKEDLIIIIKNYYNIEYTLFICEYY